MTRKIADKLIKDYEFTDMLVHNLVDGLTQEETLIQLPFEVNCLNWGWDISSPTEVMHSK